MNLDLIEAIKGLVKAKKVDEKIVFDALEMVLLTGNISQMCLWLRNILNELQIMQPILSNGLRTRLQGYTKNVSKRGRIL